jgi:hypothetical protein
MKRLEFYLIATIVASAISCAPSENYSNIQDFFSRNEVQMQTYQINGDMGGSFTTPQGTIVTIPANAFETQLGAPITGTITIEFKDIYKKSDMLLSNRATDTWTGPLKSGGEFFIRATSNGIPVLLADGKSIAINQPRVLTGNDPANDMLPFVGAVVLDSMQGGAGNFVWNNNPGDTILYNPMAYIYNFYQFSTPISNGTWGNSDNPDFFAAYPQTSITIHSNENIYDFGEQLFLVFSGVNSMVHVYNTSNYDFGYYYAPQGMSCTAVAIGVKDGNLYSGFTSITIGANQTYNINLTQTTTGDFKNSLDALN